MPISVNVNMFVGVNSGTTALWAALIGLGIGQNDEVITVPNSFIATVEAISFCGAKPVFVDVDEQTYTMNPDLLPAAITPKTKAIIPVHLFGQMADMDPIMDIARKHGLVVIEDAAQAHDAEYKGRKAGSIGDAGCFSFYPGKNLGAYGEAGAVTTNNDLLAEKIKMFRDHGQEKKYHHTIVGWNARMDGFQGAVLSAKLKHLQSWTKSRRDHAKTYDDLLLEINEVIIPVESQENKHVYHVYAIRTKKRDQVINNLKENGIGCGIHYPVPLHLTRAYESLGHGKGSFFVAERCAAEFISLPMFAELSEREIIYVVEKMLAVVEKCSYTP